MGPLGSTFAAPPCWLGEVVAGATEDVAEVVELAGAFAWALDATFPCVDETALPFALGAAEGVATGAVAAAPLAEGCLGGVRLTGAVAAAPLAAGALDDVLPDEEAAALGAADEVVGVRLTEAPTPPAAAAEGMKPRNDRRAPDSHVGKTH
ncbi:MAG: hypothetical protein QM784_26700 [Polyangiaceae bacterium]